MPDEIAGSMNFNDIDFRWYAFLDPRSGGWERVSWRTLVLDVSKRAPANSPADLARDLAQHYEKGLSRLGMHQWQALHGAGGQSRDLW